MGDHLQKFFIGGLTARKILDSRGSPTIEVEMVVHDAHGTKLAVAKAAAPSGASKGKHEVIAFPEGGVDVAIEKIERLAPDLKGVDLFEQEKADAHLRRLDGTPDLRKLGGNTTVVVSMAFAKAAASVKGVRLFRYLGGPGALELPYPLGNMVGGGKHARRGAPDIQEFLALPVGARKFSEAVFANVRVHKRVGDLIEVKDKTFTGGRGDEGAWAPNLDNSTALGLVAQACEVVGDEVGFQIRPALDVAASSFYDEREGKYFYKRDGKSVDGGEQIDLITDLIKTYKLSYVEDPLHEEDFDGFAELTQKVGNRCLICGDDLFVTNVRRVLRGIKAGAANAVLIKPNQIGTLTDAFKAVELAKGNNYTPVMSHRSGETHDETIAHLAVAWGCPMIKTGVVGGERVAKLNELMRIEGELGEKARMGKIR